MVVSFRATPSRLQCCTFSTNGTLREHNQLSRDHENVFSVHWLLYDFVFSYDEDGAGFVSLHCFLHSGRHSARDFCSAPLGLVHSYMHLLRHASSNVAAAHAVGGVVVVDVVVDDVIVVVSIAPVVKPPMTERKRCRDTGGNDVDDDMVEDGGGGTTTVLLSLTP